METTVFRNFITKILNKSGVTFYSGSDLRREFSIASSEVDHLIVSGNTVIFTKVKWENKKGRADRFNDYLGSLIKEEIFKDKKIVKLWISKQPPLNPDDLTPISGEDVFVNFYNFIRERKNPIPIDFERMKRLMKEIDGTLNSAFEISEFEEIPSIVEKCQILLFKIENGKVKATENFKKYLSYFISKIDDELPSFRRFLLEQFSELYSDFGSKLRISFTFLKRFNESYKFILMNDGYPNRFSEDEELYHFLSFRVEEGVNTFEERYWLEKLPYWDWDGYPAKRMKRENEKRIVKEWILSNGRDPSLF